jgi:dynein heavy chain
MTSFNALRQRCQDLLDEHNTLYMQSRMGLVLFLNAIQHVTRIVRIIQTVYGHALLIGMGGTGRSNGIS